MTHLRRCATLSPLALTADFSLVSARGAADRRARRRHAAAAFGALASIVVAACAGSPHVDPRKRIAPVYDKNGRLELLKYDSNGNGAFDTFSYMDGARVVRIEIDRDEDGRIDRWEYYDDRQQLTKVGMSRANDGKPDAWAYYAPGGALDRIEVSTARDGRITRTEHYDHDTMVRAEEDTDGDGRIDKWEQYQGGRLQSVAFDTRHRGAPDRRLTYASDGTAALEQDEKGDGVFVAQAGSIPTAPQRRSQQR